LQPSSPVGFVSFVGKSIFPSADTSNLINSKEKDYDPPNSVCSDRPR
jgi:hypothetical protein